MPNHSFHKFGCALGKCDYCPLWNDFSPQMEQDCPDAIQYTIFGSYFQCVKHGQQNILYNGKNQAYCSACSIDYGENNDDAIPQPTIRKKYIQMMKSEPMNEFVKEGGMFDEHMRAILYHTFLVIIL